MAIDIKALRKIQTDSAGRISSGDMRNAAAHMLTSLNGIARAEIQVKEAKAELKQLEKVLAAATKAYKKKK